DSEHAAGRFRDGDKSHGVLWIVVNELFNQLVPYLAHRYEKTQTQIVRGYFMKEVGIQRRIFRFERADEDLFSIAQGNVAFEQGGHRVSRRRVVNATSIRGPSSIPGDQAWHPRARIRAGVNGHSHP